MPTIKIPTPLRPYTNGQSQIKLKGENVQQLLREAVEQYPDLEKHLYGENDQLRPFVNLFLKETNIRELQGLETSLAEDDTLLLIPSIAGGVPFPAG